MGTLDLLESQYGEEAFSLSIKGTISLNGLSISDLKIDSFSPPKKNTSKPDKSAKPTLGKKELIGEGGMGSIYATMQKSLERDVALKQLKSDLAESRGHKEKFLEEAIITAQLEHPNIPPIHNLSRENCRLTMKKIKGKDLDAVLEENKHTKKELVRMLVPVCDALAYGHARGVLHKDIKPENIMVGSEEGEVYMMDWGIAQVTKAKHQPDALKKIRKNRELKEGTVAGTPLYMAPEQAKGDTLNLDERADVYAFGAMLYKLETGRLPITLKKGQGGIMQLLAKKINPDTKIRTAKGDLGAIAHKCIAFDKKNRYKNMLEVKKDLQNFLENQKVSARKYGPIASTVKWVQNNGGKAVAALGISAGLLLGGTAGIVALNASAAKARVEAKNSKLAAETAKSEAAKEKAEAAKELAEAEKFKADAKAKQEAEKRAEAAEKAKIALEEKLVAEQQATVAAQKAQTEAEKRALAEKQKTQAEAEAKKSLEEKLKAEQELSQLSERKRKAVFLNNDAKQQLEYARNLRDIGKKKEAIETAIRELIKAKALDPELGSVYHNLGFACSLLGKQKEAIDFYTKALEIDPSYGLSRYNRAESNLASGNLDEAITDYEAAKKTQGLNIDVFIGLSVCYMRKGVKAHSANKKQESESYFDEALEVLDKALEIDPRSGLAHRNKGETYMCLKKYEMAEKAFTSAIDHGNYYSHILLAETMRLAARAGQPLSEDWKTKARRHLSKAIVIDRTLIKDADKVSKRIR